MVRRTALPLLLVAAAVTAARAEDDDVRVLYAAAREAEADRRFGRALGLYERILAIDEEHEDTIVRHEECLPLAAWEKTLDGNPGAADLVRLGEILARIGRPHDEEAAYRDAIELDPADPEAHGHLAILHYAGRGFRGTMGTVVAETKRLLETSPHRARLAGARADFEVYGSLRSYPADLEDVLAEVGGRLRAGRPEAAAEILERAVGREIPDAHRTRLLVEAAAARIEAGDPAAARRDLVAALTHVTSADTGRAHMVLAVLDLRAGDTSGSLTHLRAAVANGSRACRMIAAQREKALRPLFEHEDDSVRRETERLADEVAGDEPIRARIRAATRRAREEGKLVLLHWYGPYCPYVMAMEERLAHPEVRALLRAKFVHVRMDYGAHHRGMTLDREYGNVYAEHGVPSFYVLDGDGTILSIQRDGPLMSDCGRCYSLERILAWLRSVEVE